MVDRAIKHIRNLASQKAQLSEAVDAFLISSKAYKLHPAFYTGHFSFSQPLCILFLLFTSTAKHKLYPKHILLRPSHLTLPTYQRIVQNKLSMNLPRTQHHRINIQQLRFFVTNIKNKPYCTFLYINFTPFVDPIVVFFYLFHSCKISS